MRVLVLCLVLTSGIASADVVIDRVGVRIAHTNADGRSWDTGVHHAPDPKLVVEIDGHEHACQVVEDSYETECALPEMVPAGDAIDVTIGVVDSDLVNDDAIGTAYGAIEPNAQGRVPLTAVGRLEAAWAHVISVPAPLFRRWSARLLALALGLVLAFGCLTVWRQRFLSPPPREKGPLELAPACAATPVVSFWRSPVLLVGTVTAIAGLVAANFVESLRTPPLVGAIPFLLGAYALTGVLIDAVAREALGPARLRVLALGAAAIAAVPILEWLAGRGALPDLGGRLLILAILVIARPRLRDFT